MTTVAAVFASFDESFLGGPSPLDRALGTRSVLGHTLHRAAQIAGVDRRCVFTHPAHEEAARGALHASGLENAFEVLAIDSGARPRRRLMRSARKWALGRWRANVCAATCFDEYVEPYCVAQVLDHYQAAAVLCLDGTQAALDPRIASDMLQRCDESGDRPRLVFTQAPPGLAGLLLRRDLVADLVQQNLTVGVTLAYRPESPQQDPITKASCLRVDPAVAQSSGRFFVDTRFSAETVAEAWGALGEDADAAAICRWARENPRDGGLPAEVELELTTRDPLPDTTLRPRGERVPRRALESAATLRPAFEEFARYDDRLLVLGGFGDPLACEHFGDVCAVARGCGIAGIAVVTPLVELSDRQIEALIEHGVDVLQVLLDADTPETYRRVHGADRFHDVVRNIERIQEVRQSRLSPQPLIVPTITRCAATLGEIEAFYDRWIQAVGSAVISGYSDFGGQLPVGTLLPVTPPVRGACRRLSRRMMLLADGRAVSCDQDVLGRQAVGDWRRQRLSEIWAGAGLGAIRRCNAERDFGGTPACASCGEWFRP
ncbi:MAG: hypothetical protein CHACPFDD_01008 [Phycisphaerae bacterium]|nr:hypothetical protein [Phycisphaerae bacterium]